MLRQVSVTYFSKMKTTVFAYFIFALCLISCSEDYSVNPDLIGRWKTPGAIYTFQDDETYCINYIHDGGPGTPVADSIFGTYLNDNKRSSLTFNQEGFRVDSSQVIILQDLNGGVWEYEIVGTELLYDSKTQTGKLKKIPETP